MGSQTAAGSSLAISAMLPTTHDAAGYAALTFVEIGQIEKLGTFGAAFAKVEYQPLKGAKQKYKGSADFGALQPSIAIDAADAGQILMLVAADDESQKLYSFRVTLQDGAKRYFRGRVFGSPETSDGADTMLLATPTVEICTRVVRVDSSGTSAPTPTPSPTLSQPSISPTSGNVGQTFTATDGTVTNGTLTGRRWLLGTTAIGTGTTVTPAGAGTLTLENTATGTNGAVITSTSNAVTVSAVAATPAPSLSLSSAVTQAEGNSGTATFVWTLTLNRDGSTAAYPFNWAVTGSGSNPADAADFGGTLPSGSGTFAAGETTKTITVLVAGDTAVEPNDTFTLTVTASGLTTVSSTGTISNDDAAQLKIAFAGSSTYEKYGTDGSGTTVANATRSTDGVTFSPMGTQGYGLLLYAGIIANRTGLSAQYMMEGHGGSTVAGWLASGSGDRKGLVDAIKAAGGCDLLNWACGFNDALQNIVVSEAQHLANLRALFALIRSETGLPNLKITVGISQLYTGTGTAGPDQTWAWVRSAEMTVAQDPNNYFSAHWYDLPQGDGIHMTGESYPAHAARIAENGLAALGLGGAVAEVGPRVTGATAVYTTKTRITLTHSRGTDFTPTTNLSGFLVSFDDGATFITPTAADRINATTIELTHLASGGGAPTIYAFRGKAPPTTAIVHDNSTRALPINPTYTAGVKAAAGTSTADPGAPTDTTAPVITSAATASQPENAAFSMTLTANETVAWSKVGGADAAKFTLSGATLTLPAQDYETPTDSDANRSYIVTVRATDTAGNVTDQTITVTITDVAEGGGASKSAKVAFSRARTAPDATFNAFNDSGSSVQNSNAGRSKALTDITGAATGWTLTTTNFNAGNDTQGTTTNANTGVYPDNAMVAYWYNGNTANSDNGGIATPSTTMTLSGLNPAKRYAFKVHGGRSITDRKVTYTAGGASQTIDAGANTTLTASFTSIAPDSSGNLTLTFAPATGYTFGYINVLEITEAAA